MVSVAGNGCRYKEQLEKDMLVAYEMVQAPVNDIVKMHGVHCMIKVLLEDERNMVDTS